MPLKICLILSLSLILFTKPVAAQQSCEQILTATQRNVSAIDQMLRHSMVVSQKNYPNSNISNYGCGAVCAVNAAQAMHYMIHASPLAASLNTVVDRVAQFVPVTSQGYNLSQILKVLSIISNQYFPGEELQAQSYMDQFLVRMNGFSDVKPLNQISKDDLAIGSSTLRLLLVEMRRTATGEHYGNHFFLFHDINGDIISMLDPNSPNIVRKFKLQDYTDTDFPDGYTFRTQALKPMPGNNIDQIFEPNLTYSINGFTDWSAQDQTM